MSTDLEKLAREIINLKPGDQLRFAADLLEAQQHGLAHSILERVTRELGAALFLREAVSRGSQVSTVRSG